MKKWWAADIILVSNLSDSIESLYQENIVLVRAETQEEANQLAVTEGRAMEVSYRNNANQEVKLKYETTLDVQELLSIQFLMGPSFSPWYLRKNELDSLMTKL